MMATEINVEAGFQCDVEVARRLFGWEERPTVGNNAQRALVPPGYPEGRVLEITLGQSIYKLVPAYSTDISQAWLVVNKMRELGWMCILTIGIGGETMAVFNRPGSPSVVDVGSTPSLAICSAALAALDAA